MKMIFVSTRAANDPSAFIIMEKGLLALSNLRHYKDTMLNRH